MTSIATPSTFIAIYAPMLLLRTVLQRRLSALTEKLHSSHVVMNPVAVDANVPSVHILHHRNSRTDLLSRKIGTLTYRRYRNRSIDAQYILPDIAAGLDPQNIICQQHPVKEVRELWISVDQKNVMLPDMRFVIDWIESCFSGLAWLQEPP